MLANQVAAGYRTDDFCQRGASPFGVFPETATFWEIDQQSVGPHNAYQKKSRRSMPCVKSLRDRTPLVTALSTDR